MPSPWTVLGRIFAAASFAMLVSYPVFADAELPLESLQSVQDGGEMRESRPLRVELDALVGIVKAPFFSPAFPEVQAQGAVLSLSASYRAEAAWQFEARLPLALMSVRQPAGSYLDEAAWGNPTLSALQRTTFAAWATRPPTAWLGFELGLPLTAAGPRGSLFENRALEAANALNAYSSPAAFSPGCLFLTPRGGTQLDGTGWGLGAELRSPLSIRLADGGLPDTADTHAFGWLPALAFDGRVRLSKVLELGVGVNTSIAVLRSVTPARPSSRVQLALAPRLQLQVTQHFGLTLRFLAPVAGPLGGATYALGITASEQ